MIESMIIKWREGRLRISDLNKFIEELIKERGDLIKKCDVKSTKWEPKGGDWFVGYDSVSECGNLSPIVIGRGRAYETKEQAEQALIFQRRAMRFFRWCVEQDPDFEANFLTSFGDLLYNVDLTMEENLRSLIAKGEVDF